MVSNFGIVPRFEMVSKIFYCETGSQKSYRGDLIWRLGTSYFPFFWLVQKRNVRLYIILLMLLILRYSFFGAKCPLSKETQTQAKDATFISSHSHY